MARRFRDTKHGRILAIFAQGEHLNTFTAASYGDSCLNSTVSYLARKYDLIFVKTWESFINRFGSKTSIIDYCLDLPSQARANTILKDG